MARRSPRTAALVVAGGLAALLVAAPAPARGDAAPAWSWPVVPPHRIVRGFEAPATPYAAGHRGIDVEAPVGSPVLAPADGRVTYAGRVVDRGVLAIDTGGGVLASLEPVTPRVAAGAVVHRGEVVAVVGVGGDHPAGVLHIGARRDGAYISPLLLLGGYERPVLLPISDRF